MAAGDQYEYKYNTSNNTNNDLIGKIDIYTSDTVWQTFPNQITGWQQYDSDYKELFNKLITYILGSNLPQTTKNDFINVGILIKEFRDYVVEYFPQYNDKIKLWEKLHIK